MSSTATPHDPSLKAPKKLGARDWKVLESTFSIDTRALSVVRILMGVLLLFQSLFLELSESRSYVGWMEYVIEYSHLIILPFAVMLLVGYRTRLAVMLCWLLYSLPLRADLLADVPVPMGYYVLNVALFWCMFLPLDRHISVDSRGKGKTPTRFLSVASGALLFQIFIIYFSAGLVKDLGEWLVDATAMQSILSHPNYETPLGVALLAYPTILALMSVATFAVEVVGSLLVIVPGKSLAKRRLVMVPVFIVFHVGIAAFMGLGLFPYVMTALWLVFLPSSFWDGISARFGLERVELEPAVDSSLWRNGLAGGAVAIATFSSFITWSFYPRYADMPAFFDWFQELAIFLTLYQRWLMFNVPSLIPV